MSDFQYFGTDTADADGKFDFLTHRPGSYESLVPKHTFHFGVRADEDDTKELLVTHGSTSRMIHLSLSEHRDATVGW